MWHSAPSWCDFSSFLSAETLFFIINYICLSQLYIYYNFACFLCVQRSKLMKFNNRKEYASLFLLLKIFLDCFYSFTVLFFWFNDSMSVICGILSDFMYWLNYDISFVELAKQLHKSLPFYILFHDIQVWFLLQNNYENLNNKNSYSALMFFLLRNMIDFLLQVITTFFFFIFNH